MTKSALIIGCGSKLGEDFAQSLLRQQYNVYGITGSAITDSRIVHQTVNWESLVITECEKFLRKLPEIDLVIFNQNATSTIEECFDFNNDIDSINVWSKAKQWQHSHYVNCILPIHFMHTLTTTKKIHATSKIIWMLSNAIFEKIGPIDYIGQKQQNLCSLQRFAKYNNQIHIGIDPVTLDADTLLEFITAATIQNSGKFYSISKTTVTERC